MFAVAKRPKREIRSTINIELPEEAKAALKELVDSSGMSQRELTNRLYEWLVQQDEIIRGIVLRQIPRSVMPDVARTILERLADQVPLEERGKVIPPLPQTEAPGAKRDKARMPGQPHS